MKHRRLILWLLTLGLLIVALVLVGLAWAQHGNARKAGASAPRPVIVYCAAGLRKPVEECSTQYQRETGTEVQIQFGGSGTLLSTLRLAKQGDLFLSADDGTVADARKLDLIREVLPLAVQRPVIAVRPGNPKNIRGLDDLLRDDVKVALANPEAASISRVTQRALGEAWKPLAAHAAVMKPTVSGIASDLSLGTVDAAIIWDSIVGQFKLEAIAAPELADTKENASACVLAFTKQPAAALRFARYLAAPEKGGAIFKASGFTPTGGDAWAAKPKLILDSGGVNRLASGGDSASSKTSAIVAPEWLKEK